MPTAFIKKLSKEGKGTVPELEKKWDDAKEIAKKEGADDVYALTTSIFKKMIKAAPVQINAARRLLAGRETGSGAGMLMYCTATDRFLLLLRSAESDSPNTWCGAGGGIEAGESPEEAVRREAWEEIGFDQDEPCTLLPLGKYQNDDGFVFHNFLGLLYSEFEPQLNHEHTDYQWCTWSEFPNNMHPQMMEAFATPVGRQLLRQYAGIGSRAVQAVNAQSRDDMMVKQLMRTTSATPEDAHLYLEACDWDYDDALKSYEADHS